MRTWDVIISDPWTPSRVKIRISADDVSVLPCGALQFSIYSGVGNSGVKRDIPTVIFSHADWFRCESNDWEKLKEPE